MVDIKLFSQLADWQNAQDSQYMIQSAAGNSYHPTGFSLCVGTYL